MTLRKMLALLLAATMMLSLVACGTDADTKKKANKDADEESTSSDLSLYEQAMAYIDEGDLESAYMLIKHVDPYTEKDEDLCRLKECLVWVPVEMSSTGGGEEYYAKFTYDEDGNVLTAVNNLHSDTSVETPYYWTSLRGTHTDGESDLYYAYDDNSWRDVVIAYDEHKNQTSYEETLSDGSWSKHTYTYDKDGNMLTDDYTSSDGSWSKEIYTYDKDGNKLAADITWSGGSWWKYTYTYDKDGNTLTEDYTSFDGSWYKETYTYDEDGNMLTDDHTSSDGSWSKYTHTYDKDGNRLTDDYTLSDGSWSKYTHTYDEDGNRLTEDYASSSGSWSKETYTYDKDGNMLTYDYTSSYGWWKYTYTYDKDGNTLTYDYTSSDGRWHKYTFDIYGNASELEEQGGKKTYTYALYYYPHGVPGEVNECIYML